MSKLLTILLCGIACLLAVTVGVYFICFVLALAGIFITILLAFAPVVLGLGAIVGLLKVVEDLP